MKRTTFISIFVCTHILFVVLQIYKQSSFIKQLYKHQELETKKRELTTQHNLLVQQLHELQNHETIKLFAQQQGMEKITLKNIKSLS